jgi:hypothetical protein
MAKLEKGEDKLINGDLNGTSPKLSRREHAAEKLDERWICWIGIGLSC